MPPLSPIHRLRERLTKGPLKDGSFIRNVLTVIAGTTVSQAIQIASIPILARLFSPEHFGALAAYSATVMILAVVANLSYQAAIVLPKRNESAFIMLICCLCISLFISSLTGLGLSLMHLQLADWLENPGLSDWWWLIPFGMLARAWFTAFTLWNTRQKTFANTAKGNVTIRLTAAATQLGMTTIYLSGFGLIVGRLSGSVAGLFYLASRSRLTIHRKYFRHFSLRRAVTLLHRFRRFPQFDLFSGTIATISRNLPVILLTYFFSPAVVGFFFVAYRIVASPLQIGATSVTQVFFQRAVTAKKSGELPAITIKVFERLMVIFFTPLALLCIAAPELTLLALGEEWTQSSVYLRWLCIWLFFSSFTSPVHRLFAILEKQNELAMLNALIFTVSVITLSVGGIRNDPTLAVALFSCGAAAGWFVQGMRTLAIAGVSVSTYFRLMLTEAVKVVPFAAAVGLTRYLTSNEIIVTLVFIAAIGVFGLLRAKFILSRKS
ncbi:MAG: oligosaccharide flippase family protein [Gammaproteobacteria bacterium]